MSKESRAFEKATILANQIMAKEECSVATIEALTECLHDAKVLPKHMTIRFRMLYQDFDIVNANYMDENVEVYRYFKPMSFEHLWDVLSFMQLCKEEQ